MYRCVQQITGRSLELLDVNLGANGIGFGAGYAAVCAGLQSFSKVGAGGVRINSILRILQRVKRIVRNAFQRILRRIRGFFQGYGLFGGYCQLDLELIGVCGAANKEPLVRRVGVSVAGSLAIDRDRLFAGERSRGINDDLTSRDFGMNTIRNRQNPVAAVGVIANHTGLVRNSLGIVGSYAIKGERFGLRHAARACPFQRDILLMRRNGIQQGRSLCVNRGKSSRIGAVRVKAETERIALSRACSAGHILPDHDLRSNIVEMSAVFPSTVSHGEQSAELLRSGFLIPERYVFQRLTLVVSGSCRDSVLEAVRPLSSRFRRKSAVCILQLRRRSTREITGFTALLVEHVRKKGFVDVDQSTSFKAEGVNLVIRPNGVRRLRIIQPGDNRSFGFRLRVRLCGRLR